ncbi:MAG: DUF4197 domain-containing protein [Desulfuromonadaceae bacterium]|nr:DUF4197 domain-containing protein [Desulfuromonadaceae bacterium]
MFLAGGLMAGEAGAKMDWLQKGKDLLKGGSTTTAAPTVGSLTNSEIGSGLKEALRVGTETVVGKLGRTDGFNADPKVRIPLPKSLETVNNVLRKAGMSSLLDDLQLKLNRAAEEATPKAKALFWKSIEEMTLEDVNGIYNGPDDAATRYFQKKMTPELSGEMRPIVDNSLSQVGAIQAYEKVMAKYRSMPFVPDVKANLSDHVVNEGIEGIFYYLAKEEAAIRQNPAKRTTDLLQKVFAK